MKRYALLVFALAAGGCAGRGPHPAPDAAALTPGTAATPAAQAGSGELLYNLLVADIATQRGAYGVAVEYYTAAARETRDASLAQRAARAALYAQDLSAAIPAAEVWRELQPADPDPYQLLAILYLQQGDTERARENLRELLTRGKFTTSADYLSLARYFNREGAREAMLMMMDEILAARPDDTEALYAYVVVAVRLNELEQADRASRTLLERRPDWQEAALARAQVLELKQDRAGSAAFLKDYVARNPTQQDARFALARMLVDLKEYRGAHDEFARLHRDRPADPDILLALVLVELQLEDTAAARRHLRALEKMPGQADRAHFYFGRVAESERRPAEALTWYARVDSGEQRLDAVIRRAEIMAEQGDLDGALALLNGEATDDETTHVRLLLTETNLLVDAREYARAETVVNQGLTLYPDDLELLFARSLVLDKLNRLAAMEADLKRILALDPDNAHALNAWGYTLAERGVRLGEAREMIERALKLAPDNPYILDSMGWVLHRLGQSEQALEYLHKSLAVLPDPEVYAHLGEVLHTLGRTDEARRLVERALKDAPRDERLLGVMERLGH